MRSRTKALGVTLPALVAAGLVWGGCQGGGPSPEGGTSLQGKVQIDGSSTVFPISQAVAEEFMNGQPGVNVTVAESGTTGGFKKFLNGEIEIADASRPIDVSEVQKAEEVGIEFFELPVAYDGLTVVVNPANDWCDSLTVAELKRIWEPGSGVKTWRDIRPEWPNEPIKLFGPGSDSGTFDYFTEAIVQEKRASRADYTQSEDDNILVMGVAGEKYGLGYFGLAYYEENKSKVKAVAIDGGSGAVTPSAETVANGTYSPLSRPILIYVNKKALERSEVKAFVAYYLEHAGQLASEVGYVPLSDAAYAAAKAIIEEGKSGTRFGGSSVIGKPMEEVLSGS
ncbi:MAG: PstS family phosphate ABC transporter substrate-binding protein [Armatimonadetes bacterium]|nr:MAG: PstS family phosphate ABC transporter substrate-binding protein [Armatimonadota bacterium]